MWIFAGLTFFVYLTGLPPSVGQLSGGVCTNREPIVITTDAIVTSQNVASSSCYWILDPTKTNYVARIQTEITNSLDENNAELHLYGRDDTNTCHLFGTDKCLQSWQHNQKLFNGGLCGTFLERGVPRRICKVTKSDYTTGEPLIRYCQDCFTGQIPVNLQTREKFCYSTCRNGTSDQQCEKTEKVPTVIKYKRSNSMTIIPIGFTITIKFEDCDEDDTSESQLTTSAVTTAYSRTTDSSDNATTATPSSLYNNTATIAKETQKSTTTTTKEPLTSSSNLAIILGVAIPAIFIIAVLIGVLIYSRTKSTAKPEQNAHDNVYEEISLREPHIVNGTTNNGTEHRLEVSNALYG